MKLKPQRLINRIEVDYFCFIKFVDMGVQFHFAEFDMLSLVCTLPINFSSYPNNLPKAKAKP